MNFRFNPEKATQVAAEFLRREGGAMSAMKLVRLFYLLDRRSLLRRGLPVVGGDYFSMKNGPVTSEVLDLIQAGTLDGFEIDWAKHITDRANYEVSLKTDPGLDCLSESELTMIGETYAQHGGQSPQELAEWFHRNCSEWRPTTRGRHEIRAEDILEAGGRSDDYIRGVLAREEEARTLQELLG
ncbi:MAG: SocA family protein [Verrucomicrobia bacterium]|nr:SocA family protein [Verrucomicrobiota bacterium]